MKQARITWQCTDTSVHFTASSNAEVIPVRSWADYALRGASDAPFSLNILEQLHHKGWADLEGVTATIPNNYLAQCQPWELTALTLPPPSPLHVRVKPKGSLTIGQNFSVEYGCYILNRPVMVSRVGMLLKTEGKEYCLLEPYYSIVTKIDAYKLAPLAEPEARMHWWAELCALTPDPEVIENATLRSYKIARANFFTVSIQSVRGDLRISPRLLAESPPEASESQDNQDIALLPQRTQSKFVRDFEAFSLRGKYALGDGYFLSLPQEMQAGLEVIKKINRAPIQEKIDFINNPYAVLKERLGDMLPEEIIDSFFVETPVFLHERVQGLCIWETRNVFPKQSSGQKWLPDDLPGTVHLVIQQAHYHVTVPELELFIADVVNALESEASTVFLQEKPIAVDFALLENLKSTARLFRKKIEEEHIETQRLAPKLGDVEETDAAIPSRLTWMGDIVYHGDVTPHAHQQEGIAWLQEHWSRRTSGALLADDMGLGKTLQTLSFMWWLRRQMEEGHTCKLPMLIVAPTALIKNWQDEAQKFFGKALGTPLEAYGSFFSPQKESRDALRETLLHSDWAITTYETMRDKIEFFVGPFALLVFDEAQKIKNPGALVSCMAKSIKSDFCLALTGTPVENSLRDIVNIIDRVQPERKQKLSSLVDDFEMMDRGTPTFANAPKDTATKENSFTPEAEESQESHEAYSKAGILLKMKKVLEGSQPPLLLRRLKDTHWGERPQKTVLPPYEDTMPPEQAALYDTALAKAKEKIRMGSMGAVLEAIQWMRQISLHPPLDPSEPPEKMLTCSARIVRLMAILDDICARGEKVLIFVEYLDTQARLAKLLSEKYALSVRCINGGVAATRRQEIVDLFQGGPAGFDLLLLSPKAGGVGLNLTAANHVIHLTRWWNPAVEDQCTDRVYRIGQKKQVFLHYPLAIHPQYGEQSFDCNLHRLLTKKRALSQDLLTPADPGNNREELAALLGEH